MFKYEIVLMDADDTLFDFKRAEKTALTSTMKHYNLPCTDDVIEEYSKINLSLWKKLEKGEVTKDELKYRRFRELADYLKYSGDTSEFNGYYTECLSECGFIFDDAEKLCRALYGNCRMFITTNGIKQAQTGRFERSGLKKYIEDMFISEEIGFQKPSEKYFSEVFRRIGVTDKSKVIILGDSLTSDMQGGRNAGITTCRFVPPYSEKSGSDLCDYEISDLMEFVNIVKG